MRLLNTTTLKLTEFTRDVPPYAILSHTWGDEEVTFQEIGLPERHKKKGFRKIRWCCQQAKRDTLEWAWVDTCCIDKTSSAELSEAINSMYNWYREAQVCYVYLEDVPDLDADLDPGLDSDADDESEAALRWDDRFRPARWFTRGWCLQELIAPGAVEFYSAGWREIGTKLSLCERISKITGIPSNVLLDPDSALEGCCLAQRMSWASARKTSRVEDEAYCLLGIFGVHMPLLYGEGERAFYRLQEEIIRQTEDYSFLLWSEVPPDDRWLAPGHYFRDSVDMVG
ncbi:heterokaryon incompatibility protein-domain-containing protein [Staphylotrichum tortipilum]|uniref:Heterokaryon incompatibility protein-domain-containing protein n=1 Tax=Staphylotrichum tortipilum TaxID=2831512 RepID=A0AAN6MJF3_9PEZI|nr:heterokaryon incompatibility protein-domain-containing protein [Staphylotrichum longicolle]